MLDDRTGSIELLSHLQARRLPVNVCRLEFGDLAFEGSGPGGPVLVGVERKRLSDMLSSKREGRLAGHQLPGLLRDYGVVYVVVEGIYRANPDTGALEVPRHGSWVSASLGRKSFAASELEGFYLGMENRANVKIRRTNNERDTAMFVHTLWTWWGTPWESHRSLDVAYTPPPPTIQLVRPGLVHRMVKEIDGFGWDKAKAVAAAFPTMEDALAADEKRWAGIDGIGKILAKRAVEALHGKQQPKGADND